MSMNVQAKRTALVSAPVTDADLDAFALILAAHITGQLRVSCYKAYKIERNAGARYVRFVRKIEFDNGGIEEHGSAYCFVERATGLIFKPAGFSAPAKHARASMHDADKGMSACGQHGVSYLR